MLWTVVVSPGTRSIVAVTVCGPVGGGDATSDGCLSPTGCNGTNRLELFVTGNTEQILLTARLDNLGKGASGAAVQNLNLMLGVEETTGLA